MKKLFTLFAACMIAVNGMGQDPQYSDINHTIDSLVRYKLYPTLNTSIFLKLDTRTGEINQLSVPLNENYLYQSYLGKPERDDAEADTINGRYELYPTAHQTQFILINQIDGNVYLVIWNPRAANQGSIKEIHHRNILGTKYVLPK